MSPWPLLLALIAGITAYRLVARALVDPGLHFDEAQYFVWSLDPAAGYFTKPPLVAWVIAAARAVCGEGTACIRSPSPIALALATVAVYATGRALFDARSGFWAALLLLLAPIVGLLSWVITTDALLIAAWAVALFGFVRALQADAQGGALRWWLLTGAAAGLGLMSKYTMGVFALSAAGFLLTSPVHRHRLRAPGPYAGAALAAAIFAPNVAWNAAHHFATLRHTAEIAQLGAGTASLARAAEFLASQLAVFGPVAFGVFVVATWQARRRDDAAADWRWALLAWFAWPFLLVIAGQAFAARAHANWAAPAYVAAALLAARWLVLRPTRRWLVATLACNVLIMAVAYHYRQVAPALGVDLPARADPIRSLQGWDGLGGAIAQALERHGGRLLVEDRRLMSLAMYYGGPRTRDALAWNPGRNVDNHYRLTRDVEGAPRGPFLFLADVPRDAQLAPQFEYVQPLGMLDGGPCPGCERRVYAYRLGDFRGYDR